MHDSDNPIIIYRFSMFNIFILDSQQYKNLPLFVIDTSWFTFAILHDLGFFYTYILDSLQWNKSSNLDCDRKDIFANVLHHLGSF